ncbi:MAG TPA: molybdopterin-synthase adenylyltransferase MoeB [Thermoanaerobaculia bacterium]|nr:molybdopterin-synthase adenylyltransferase MoeB [Thermoanaerobaculia bacterium]
MTRYSRQIALPEFGEEGQRRLAAGSVAIVGAGGLGSPAALYLAAAGVGRIGLIDFDAVDESNLHRQVLYTTKDVGRAKLDAARDRLSDTNIETHNTALTSDNALELLGRYDVVIDGTDNFPTRYLVNDACILLGKPNVYGSVFRFEGQLSVFDARVGPCYRCLYPDPPPPQLVPNCAEAGVLGVLPGIIGTMQASEAIKLLAGIGEPLIGRLLLFDALRATWREMKLRKQCDRHAAVTRLIDYEGFCEPMNELDITPDQLAEILETVTLLDVREPYEWEVSRLEGAIHIPLQQLPRRLAEVPRDKEIIVYCRVGGRSAHAQHYMLQQGFERVRNLVGGLMAWAKQRDPKMPVA